MSTQPWAHSVRVRARVASVLQADGGWVTTAELCAETELSAVVLTYHLRQMRDLGRVRRMTCGRGCAWAMS
jgi:hypothetical protein